MSGAERNNLYFATVVDFLTAQSKPVCVLGATPSPDNIKDYGDLVLATVIIPPDRHVRNMKMRKQRLPNNDRISHDRIRTGRDVHLKFSEKASVPLFESFSSAIEASFGIID